MSCLVFIMGYHSAWQLTGLVNEGYVTALVIIIEGFFFFLLADSRDCIAREHRWRGSLISDNG